MRPPAIQQLQANFRTSIANVYYTPSKCPSPLNISTDVHAEDTCSNVDDAGLAFVTCIPIARVATNSWLVDITISSNSLQAGSRPLYHKPGL